MYKLKMKSRRAASIKENDATIKPCKTFSEAQRSRVQADLARCLIITVSANVENPLLSDSDFRSFVRNSLPTTLGGVQSENKKEA